MQDHFKKSGNSPALQTYEGGQLASIRPSNLATGICTIDGRKVALVGGDFTVRGGAADANIGNKSSYMIKLAHQWHLPYIIPPRFRGRKRTHI
jgi:acetyl-CoA carboxylase carboxyltransferase component